MQEKHNIEDINAIIAEVGPLDDGIAEVLRLGPDTWAIRFAAADIQLEFDERMDRLMLSVDIGTIAAARRQSITEALIALSLLWRQTGGLRFGLSGPESPAFLMVDLAGGEITAKQIAIVASNLADRSIGWRAFLEATTDENVAPSDVQYSHPMIRA